MAAHLLMPKATAVWLIDNTTLSFKQIAAFCELHPLEIQAIADGDTAHGVRGFDPVMSGQISRDEIEEGEKDPNYVLRIQKSKITIPPTKKRAARYTPLSKRQDRPNAILWLLRNHPTLKDTHISRLVGTTKSTIEQIRNRTHWNSANLVPIDPVTLGLCSQIDLNREVALANKNNPSEPEPMEPSKTLLPASTTEKIDFKTRMDMNTLRVEDVFSRFPSSKKDEKR